jgi:hypothetical protein
MNNIVRRLYIIFEGKDSICKTCKKLTKCTRINVPASVCPSYQKDEVPTWSVPDEDKSKGNGNLGD